MISFIGRLIIKLVTWILSVFFGIVHLALVIVLDLATKVVSPCISFFLLLAIGCLILKNYMNAGFMAAFIVAGYLIIAVISLIDVFTENASDFFRDISRIKLLR